ncbi:MAG: thiamine ABC transporter substrate-binding protein [Spirochaetales bacterium]|nr:thiamine ABC transporter substrate-binding protein [Spirochaetales bacterium]
MRTHLYRAGNGFEPRARQLFVSIVFALLVILAASCAKSPEAPRPEGDAEGPLVVYAYDSFAAEWGPGPALAALYEKRTGRKLELVSKGDAGQVLAAALLEKGAPEADVYLGIDDRLAPRAFEAGVLEPYRPEGAARVPAELVMDAEWRLTPYDWGAFAIIWDSEKLATPPGSLAELAAPEYGKKLILMDARTSTPGLGFAAWTLGVYGEGLSEYWRDLKDSILTVAPGWDLGYGLFTSGEAPLVLSYTTSPAYHVEYEGTDRYKALVFPEGHPWQIEGAGIARGTRRPAAARAFIELLLDPEFQILVPTTQWMYPVDPATPLPASFDAALKPGRAPAVEPDDLEKALGAIAAELAS